MTAEPERIGRYRILHRLGSGGMGDVYAGVDETLQRRVALKVIRADRRLNVEAQERFLREARILSKLDHANICRAYDYIRGDEADWLVIELVDGRSLSELLPFDVAASRALAIASEIAAVLVVTHAAGIVHRDLKPGNVMITAAGHAKVLDFGIARGGETARPVGPAPAADRTEDDAASGDSEQTRTVVPAGIPPDAWDGTRFETQVNVAVGTLPYMSPEQAAGHSATTASDMFSFGLLIYEMVAGRRAYPHGLDRLALSRLVQDGRIDPLPGSGELERLVRRLTAVAPSQRPTAVEALERLRWIQEAPRRRVRRLMIAAAVLVMLGSGAKYTVDLQRERTAALAAEADANRRRGQAETLIGFMLGDLRSKLETAGRLELLEAVGGQAMAYFSSVPAASLTGEELSQRVQALYQIGAVHLQQDDFTAARAAFDQSLEAARQLAARDPGNADWQVRLANAHFYAGLVRQREDDLLGAMRELSAYRDIAAALHQRDPANPTWALEWSYALGGVAFVQERQGDLDGARSALEQALAMKERIVAQDGGVDRQQDLAVAHNRLGVVLRKLGHVGTAFEHYQADLRIRRRLVAADPANMALKTPLFVALDTLAAAHEDAAQLAVARALYQESYQLMVPLASSDPRNVEWRRDVTVADRRLGDVHLALGQMADARDRYLRAAAAIRPIAAAAPTAMLWQQDVAKVETGLAAAELAAGRLEAARAAATSAERVVLPHFQRRPDADLGMLLGATRLVAAEIAAASGQTASARALRERALEVVRSVPGARVIGARAVEARALLALGRIDEARPIVSDLERLGYRHHQLTRAWRPHASAQPR
jgi:tetratricopeptide (TPR) repeat protein/predicted Ser/Thr protein kinase